MGQGVSFMQYMRAHGNTPGPTQRPLLAGAITGGLAEIPSALVLWYSAALDSLARALGIGAWPVLALLLTATVSAGALYGRVFSRAANDRRGGWLFGISYGFLIWMFGPATVLQWVLSHPLAVGVAAMGMLGAHLVYGLALGLLFPWIHTLLQCELSKATQPKDPRKLYGARPEAGISPGGARR
jgi:hypothetical protein